LAEIWEAVGMKVYSVSPDVHDSIVANVSHLPHIVSGTLCNTALKFPELDLRNYSGPGFRDSTRISSGNPEIWDCIIADNRQEILNALKNFSSELNAIIDSIENCQSEKIGKFLRDAKAYRDKL
jgi:prephenate dehydrogenase